MREVCTYIRFKIAVGLIDVALRLVPEVVAGGDDVYGRVVRVLKATPQDTKEG